MAKGFLAGGAIVVLLTAVAVVSTTLLFLHTEFEHARPKTLPPDIERELQDVAPGDPQTILVLGTDHRFGVRRAAEPVRSDTMMAIRVDPDRGGTAVLSIPRDLQVTIPRHGVRKINAAYAIGGAKLVVATVRSLGLDVSHVIGVDFHGFSQVVNTVGCVYVDVDRRYFNDNDPPVDSNQPYAAIDLQPGYQRLCGGDSLDYVRFRHLDDDFVRAARQQDFLRQAKQQIGLSKAIDDRDELLKIFGDYTESDLARASDATLFGLLKLGYAASKAPVREVPFPPTQPGPGASLVVAPGALRRAISELEHGGGPRGTAAGAQRSGAAQRRPGKAARDWRSAPGLVAARTEGENRLLPITTKLRGRLPVFFPTRRLATGGYSTSAGVRSYAIEHSGGRSHVAYRIVLWQGDAGQYYGVQGTTWRTPPILRHPTDRVSLRGRTYLRFFDGRHLAMIAWRTKSAAYWVSNTLSRRLSNAQMTAIAGSLDRIGR